VARGNAQVHVHGGSEKEGGGGAASTWQGFEVSDEAAASYAATAAAADMAAARYGGGGAGWSPAVAVAPQAFSLGGGLPAAGVGATGMVGGGGGGGAGYPAGLRRSGGDSGVSHPDLYGYGSAAVMAAVGVEPPPQPPLHGHVSLPLLPVRQSSSVLQPGPHPYQLDPQQQYQQMPHQAQYQQQYEPQNQQQQQQRSSLEASARSPRGAWEASSGGVALFPPTSAPLGAGIGQGWGSPMPSAPRRESPGRWTHSGAMASPSAPRQGGERGAQAAGLPRGSAAAQALAAGGAAATGARGGSELLWRRGMASARALAMHPAGGEPSGGGGGAAGLPPRPSRGSRSSALITPPRGGRGEGWGSVDSPV
jgi:hypothetical protein